MTGLSNDRTFWSDHGRTATLVVVRLGGRKKAKKTNKKKQAKATIVTLNLEQAAIGSREMCSEHLVRHQGASSTNLFFKGEFSLIRIGYFIYSKHSFHNMLPFHSSCSNAFHSLTFADNDPGHLPGGGQKNLRKSLKY